MSKSTLIKSRRAAFTAQGGHCFYCNHSMWQGEPEKFSQAYGVPPASVWRLQCTAEQLLPREEGGRDTRDNIVAACACCNRLRHRICPARGPEAHRAHVQRRLSRGGWHPSSHRGSQSWPREMAISKGAGAAMIKPSFGPMISSS